MLRLPEVHEAHKISAYYARNRGHLLLWEHLAPEVFADEFWRGRIEGFEEEWRRGLSRRFYLFPHDDQGETLGTVGVSNIIRGRFQSAHFGFGLDHRVEGQGLMREACEAAIADAFGQANLHRLEANHQPQNVRSAGLLRRLGFTPFGYARDYLFVNGRWVDNVNTQLINPRFVW